MPCPEPKKTLHISTLQIPSSGDKNQGIMLYLAFANVFTSALEFAKQMYFLICLQEKLCFGDIFGS